MRYLLGSSFYEHGKNGPEFRKKLARVWYDNNLKADIQPTRTVVIADGSSQFPVKADGLDVVSLTGNCGHCEQLIKGHLPNEYSGWSSTMAATAMIAYADMADYIYKEEDCLAFGPWVSQLYKDLGDGDLAFGRKMNGPPWMPCAQSLFIVRHRFIPRFVSTYLMMGGDRDKTNLGEHKFCKMEANLTSLHIKRLSFGVDRERPIRWDDHVHYFQQPTNLELIEADRRGLISWKS